LRNDPAFTGREEGIIKLECLREDSAAAVVNPPGGLLRRRPARLELAAWSFDQRSLGQSWLTTIASKDAAIESHASSIHRAWPVMIARAAPMVAMMSARPATAHKTCMRDLINSNS
jgi:hypothetical protein